MNPLKYAQMMKYLTRVKKQKPDLPDVFPASKAPIPAKTQNVEEIEAINRFMRANPRTEKAGGGRIGFMKGELVRQGPNTGKVAVKDLKIVRNKKGKIISRQTKYFKDMDAANAAIKKHKEGKFGQLKFKKSKKILNDPKLKAEFLKYAMGKDVTGKMIRKKYGLSNEEFFQGGLREIIDKDFLQYSKSQALKSKTIKNMLLLHNNKLSKDFIRNGLIVPDDIIEKLGLNTSEAATATARLSQHYSGQDFGFKELKTIRRNNKAGDKLFDKISKFAFGNPYRSNLYKISLQLIDDQLGNERGTFESLKNQARYILKKNKIKGFDINEIAGVVGTAKTGVGEFSQFIDIMDSNLNQKQMASFQAAFSKARQNIKNDPNSFAIESKKLNKLAGIFEREYGVKLPRIRDLNEIEKFYSPKRLKELADQGLDIKAASKELGYTLQMPSGAVTAQEFIGNEKVQANVLKKMGFKCKFAANKGGAARCDDPASYVDDIKKTRLELNSSDVAVRAAAKAKLDKSLQVAKTLPQIGKFLRRVGQATVGGVAKALQATGLASPVGLAIEGMVEGGIYDYYRGQGYTHDQAYQETFFPGIVSGRPEGVPWYGGAESLLEKELVGDPQQNPKVAQYVSALKDQEQVFDAFGRLEQGQQASRKDIIDAAQADIRDLTKTGTISNINKIMNPESMTSQAYQTAVERQAGAQDQRARDYKAENYVQTEPSDFQQEKLQRERNKDMLQMFPPPTVKTIQDAYKEYGVEDRLKDFTAQDYKDEIKRFDDFQKQSYFAENFRLEKAGGGIAKMAGVSSGVAPVSGPNPQGLLSLKNRVRNY